MSSDGGAHTSAYAMAESGVAEPLQYNVIVFNNITNNGQDIKLLVKTFRGLNCRVKVHYNLSLAQFEEEINKLFAANFVNFGYIAVVVLDNRNRYAHEVSTSDAQTLRLNNDLLVRIQQNRHFANRKRLFIVQTNQTAPPEAPPQAKNWKKVLYYGPTVTLFGTGPGERLKDHWPTPDAAPSPFIKSFCRNFATYHDESMRNIYYRIREDLQNEDICPVIDEGSPIVFGYALTDTELSDHYPLDDESDEDPME